MAYLPKSDSVVGFQSDATKLKVEASILGTVPVTGSFAVSSASVVQEGTWRTSVVSSTPSSMLVGASVIGAVPIKNDNTISTNNSSSSTLGADAVFTGTGDDVSGYATVTCQIDASHNSATDGMTMQFSTDNTNWDDTYTWTYTAADGARRFQFPITAQYFRQVYTNGGTEQSHLRMQTILHRQNQLTSIHRIKDDVDPDRSAQIIKSALVAQTNGTGDFKTIQANAAGILKIGGSVDVDTLNNSSISGTVDVGNVPQTSVHGAVSIVGGSVGIEGTPTTLQPAGSVMATTATVTIGAVSVIQQGDWRTSVVSSTPSSLLAGVSVIGLAPVTLGATRPSISGTVITAPPQGTSVSGTVDTIQSGTVITSVSGIPQASIHGKVSVAGGGVNVDNLQGASVSGTVSAAQSGAWTNSVVGAVSVVGTVNTDVVSSVATVPVFRTSIQGVAAITNTSVTTLVAAAGAGVSNHITDIAITNTGSVTTLVTFKSQGGASVLGYTIAPSEGGSNLPGLITPISTPANTTFDVQATSPTSTLYATVKGYKA